MKAYFKNLAIRFKIATSARGNGRFNVRVYLIENALARFKEVSKP